MTSKGFNTAFKEGDFVFNFEIDDAVKILDKMLRLCYIIKGKRRISTKISRAIRFLSKSKNFDLDSFIDKIAKYQGKLYNCTTSDEYIEMFININNYKARINKISTLEVFKQKEKEEEQKWVTK